MRARLRCLAWLSIASLAAQLACFPFTEFKETWQAKEEIREAARSGRIDAPFGEDNSPPLHTAVRNGYLDLVEWLLDEGASTTTLDPRGQSALHLAVQASELNLESLRTLLAHGAPPDIQEPGLQTPLHFAASQTAVGAIELLLEAGAKPGFRIYAGSTPLHLAATPQPDASEEAVARAIHALFAGARRRTPGTATRTHRSTLPLSPVTRAPRAP